MHLLRWQSTHVFSYVYWLKDSAPSMNFRDKTNLLVVYSFLCISVFHLQVFYWVLFSMLIWDIDLLFSFLSLSLFFVVWILEWHCFQRRSWECSFCLFPSFLASFPPSFIPYSTRRTSYRSSLNAWDNSAESLWS